MKKLLAIILTICFLVTCFTACKDTTVPPKDNSSDVIVSNTDDTSSENATSQETIVEQNTESDSSKNEITDSKVENTEKENKTESNSTSSKTNKTDKNDKNDKSDKNTANSTNKKPSSSGSSQVGATGANGTASGTEVKPCTHKTTTIKNKKSATCTKKGYTGDVYCKECDLLLAKGSSINAVGHNTEIRGSKKATTKVEGYTGDTYCKTCDKKLASGKTIPKLEEDTSNKCTHKNIITKNKKSATCGVAGYTGDDYCKDCNALVAKGSSIPAKTHVTEIRNAKAASTTSEGYTGDTYCKICDKKLKTGESIPKLETKKTTYVSENGREYVVDKDTNIFEYTLKLNTEYIKSPYREIELEIFRLCNEERKKAGVPELEWYEEIYYFAHTRSEEAQTVWSHTRPDGRSWDSVYDDKDIIVFFKNNSGSNLWMGENLFRTQTYKTPTSILEDENFAQNVIDSFMESKGHRENMLFKHYTKCAFAITVATEPNKYGKYTAVVTQHFFG